MSKLSSKDFRGKKDKAIVDDRMWSVDPYRLYLFNLANYQLVLENKNQKYKCSEGDCHSQITLNISYMICEL